MSYLMRFGLWVRGAGVALAEGVDRRWDIVREFSRGLSLAWVSLASVLLAFLMFWFPQAQDLFLEVRGEINGWKYYGVLFWIAFYLAVIFVWMVPVYVSARWILYKFRIDDRMKRDRAEVCDWVCRSVPRFLAVACLAAVLFGQVMALANTPYLFDTAAKAHATKVEDAWSKEFDACVENTPDDTLRVAVDAVYCFARHSGGLSHTGILAAFEYAGVENVIFFLFASIVGLGVFIAGLRWLFVTDPWPVWFKTALVIYAVWVGTFWAVSFVGPMISFDVAEFLLLATALGNYLVMGVVIGAVPFVVWMLVPFVFMRIPITWIRLLLLGIWWLVMGIILAMCLLLLGAAIYGFAMVEISGSAGGGHDAGVGHLAILPPITIALMAGAWWLLRPDGEGRPTRLGGFLLWRTPQRKLAAFDHVDATATVWNPAFYIILFISVALLVAQAVLHPVVVSDHIYRAMLLPFVLGVLVSVLTYVSHLSFRFNAPIILGGLLLGTALNTFREDNHNLRPVKPDGLRPTLEETVKRWAEVNCRPGAWPAISQEDCSQPIIVSAAGGASRAAFLVAATLGKLMDEDATKGSDSSRQPFHKQLFAISGVSGGALGAAVTYAALADAQVGSGGDGSSLRPPCKQGAHDSEYFAPGRNVTRSWRNCLERILAGDFLSPVFVGLVGNDIFGASFRGDRAYILEQAWERRYGKQTESAYWDEDNPNAMEHGLVALRSRVVKPGNGAWLPMLLLNGTSVTTGRRIVASDVDTLYTELSPDSTEARRRLFRDAYDLHELFRSPRGHYEHLAVDPDGRHMLASYDGAVQVWDRLSQNKERDVIRGVKAELSPDGRYFATYPQGWDSEVAFKGVVKVYSSETYTLVDEFELGSRCEGVSFSRDGSVLLAWSDSTVVVRHISRKTTALSVDSDEERFNFRRPALSPNRSSVVISYAGGFELRNVANNTIHWKAKDDLGSEGQAVFSPDGKQIYTFYGQEWSRNPSVLVWDAQSGRKIDKPLVFPSGFDFANAVEGVISPDGSKFLLRYRKGAVIWRPEDQAVVKQIPDDGEEIRSIAFLSSSDRVVITTQHKVRVEDLKSGATIVKLDSETGESGLRIDSEEGSFLGAVVLRNDVRLVTWDDNGAIRFWSMADGSEISVQRLARSSFGECDNCDVRLSTAVTVSARFPVISPHGNVRNLQGELVDRVVDGGYYENFGATSAYELADVLATRYALQPAVILINNEPLVTGMNCIRPGSRIEPPTPAHALPFSIVRSPFDAVMGTRGARGTYAAVELCSRIDADNFAFITVEPDKTDADKALSMSWWLSKRIQKYLDQQVDTNETQENRAAFEKIARWRHKAVHSLAVGPE